MGFSPVTFVLAKKGAMAEFGVKTERKTEAITFDGNLTEENELFPIELHEDYAYIKVSDTAVVPTKYSIMSSNGEVTADISTLERSEEDDIGYIYYTMVEGNYIPLIVCIPASFDIEGVAVNAGTYVALLKSGVVMYVSRVEYTTETIHPIGPKYLPGVAKINLYDWGIDLYSILMEMLNAGKTCVAKTVNVGYQFWEALGAAGDNFVFVQGGDYDYIAYPPSVYTTGEDMAVMVGLNVSMVVNNAFIKSSVFLKYNDANTSMLVMEATMITPE